MTESKRAIFPRFTALLLIAAMLSVFAAAALSGCSEATAPREPVEGPVIDGEEAYHVIVTSGEPEGIAAALAAGRNGMRTLLVEEGDALGGLMTLGWLNFLDMNHGVQGELLTRGIFEEFHTEVVKQGSVFDIDAAIAWFAKVCDEEPNLTVMLNTEIVAPVMDGNTIAGLVIREIGQSETMTVRSLAVIDSTVDGDVAAAAGAPYTVGAEDRGEYGTKQGVTLVFEISGINWSDVYNYLRNDDNPNTGADSTAAWGYAPEALNYVTVDGNMRLRGPNVALRSNGNVLLNALVIFGVDALDPDSLAEGIERGRREIPHIIEFMRESFVGFENAAYVSHAPRLYVRETRHFIGEYRLTITDVLENRDHWDRIGHGSYSVDLQATNVNDAGNIIGFPEIYSIPFRSLVPLEIDQLLVVGRAASYDSLPHGSARVIPIGMVAGEAAGTAVAYSVEHGVTFRQMSRNPEAVAWLQNQLIMQGAHLVEYTPPRIDAMDHWAYPGLVVQRELGMEAGGYANDYGLDNDVPNRWMLQNRVGRMMRIISDRTADRGRFQVPAWSIELDSDEVSVGLLLITAAQCVSLGDRDWVSGNFGESDEVAPMPFPDPEAAREYLVGQGVIGAENLHRFSNVSATATRGQLVYILGAVYTVLMHG